jgi:hypothetical protein
MLAMGTVHATHTELQDAPIVRSVRLATATATRPRLPPGGWMGNRFPRPSRRKSRAVYATGTLPAESAR